LSIGDISVTQTSTTVATVVQTDYDTNTLGARRYSNTTYDGMIGMMHSIKITDTSIDTSTFSKTGIIKL